jgi:hypothetical protein
MAESRIRSESVPSPESGVSLLGVANVLLRWRRRIVWLGVAGALIGLSVGLLTKRIYVSSATFLPQGSDGNVSVLGGMASQLGVRVPTTGGGWGPAVYVQLLRSRSLLDSIALDTFVVAEQGGARVALMDLLDIKGSDPTLRLDKAVTKLGAVVGSREVKALGAVEVTASTHWPSVSLALVERLVDGVNRFNLQTRKSQAAAERQFVDVQAAAAERELRDAENMLQEDLQSNRNISASPQLLINRDRLTRTVSLRQQIYTTLLQSREDARIREVRDTPVITMLESPHLPVVGESRQTVQKALTGGIAGVLFGAAIALIMSILSGSRAAPSDDAREFFQLLDEAMPAVLRNRGRKRAALL